MPQIISLFKHVFAGATQTLAHLGHNIFGFIGKGFTLIKRLFTHVGQTAFGLVTQIASPFATGGSNRSQTRSRRPKQRIAFITAISNFFAQLINGLVELFATSF